MMNDLHPYFCIVQATFLINAMLMLCSTMLMFVGLTLFDSSQEKSQEKNQKKPRKTKQTNIKKRKSADCNSRGRGKVKSRKRKNKNKKKRKIKKTEKTRFNRDSKLVLRERQKDPKN